MGEGIIIGGLLLALLSLFSGKKDGDVPKPTTDRDPFCPPHPDGRPRKWDANAGMCVDFTPGTPEPQNPDDDPIDVIPGYVVDDLDAITKDYPEPATFYQVIFGDKLLGTTNAAPGSPGSIVYRTLRRAGFLAAREFGGLADAEAHNFGAQIAGTPQLRTAYKNALQCAQWNDRLYATYGYKDGVASPSPGSGRALRLLPNSAANRIRIRGGQAPLRSIKLRTPNNSGDGSGTKADGAPGGSLEFLWLPGLDLQHLWLTHQLRIVLEDPPAWVMALGIEDRSNSGEPANGWGC